MATRSRADAIRAMCRSCIYDTAAPGKAWQQTEACTCLGCPLWSYRPVSRGRLPERIMDSVQSTLGLTDAQAQAWRDNPHERPDLTDFRAAPSAGGPFKFYELIASQHHGPQRSE